MKERKKTVLVKAPLFYGFLALFAVCAYAGSGIPGGLYLEIALAVSLAAWLSAGNRHPSFCLVLSVAAAVSGLLLGAPAPAMAASSVAALAAWDTVSANPAGGTNGTGADRHRYTAMRLKFLASAMAGGAAVFSLKYILRLQVPFFLLLAVVIGAVVCFDRLLAFMTGRE